MRYKILMSNLGYGRGIGGSLDHHIRYAHRHFYCSQPVQEAILRQLGQIIEQQDPDLCCFVEIDKGSTHSANYNQLEALINEHYSFFDIENKYAKSSWLRSFPLTHSKSNAFLSKSPLPFEKIYLTTGTKRLIYKIQLAANITLFFTHFSLSRKTRQQQLYQLRDIIHQLPGEIILLGDFNILTGFSELAPLLQDTGLKLLNMQDRPTFRFHRRHMVLDLCICSQGISAGAQLEIIPQPYSDHAALLLEITL